MSTIKASRLSAVLEKARNAGHAEEHVCIAGVNLVIRSLEPESYNAIMESLEDVPEISYPMSYQVEHVCRAIVQIDELDFRDIKYVEMEGEPGAPAVKVERHQWVRDNLVATWSREMVTVAFRKVMDAIKAAEVRSYEGVQFRIADETDEEKYRRLLGELKEAGTELPDDLREAILKEEGLTGGTSKAELESLEERSRTWPKEEVPELVPHAAPDDQSIAPRPVEPVQAPAPPPPPRAPQQLVDAAPRVPLNRTPIEDPIPSRTAEQGVVMANHRSPVPPPDQVHTLTRSDRVAALEDDPNLFTLERAPAAAPDQVNTIFERQPTSGVNSRYVNPHTNPSRAGGLNPRRR